MKGAAGDDELSGDNGNDTIDGGAGDDLIDGGAGNDKLLGGAGDDTIQGGLGKDDMTGGAGADTFVFANAQDSGVLKANRDIIRDFKSGEDKIDLTGFAHLITDTTVVSGSQASAITTPVAVAAAGNYDAKDADVNFQMTAGDYTYNIANFGKGDVIAFPEGQTPTVKNSDFSDGIVDLQYATQGKVLTVHLTDLTPAQDAQLYSVNQFNSVFGANTVTPAPVTTSPVVVPVVPVVTTTPTTNVTPVVPDVESTVDGLELVFIEKADLINGYDATGAVWFDAALKVLFVSTNADIKPEFAIELSGVKTFTADDLII